MVIRYYFKKWRNKASQQMLNAINCYTYGFELWHGGTRTFYNVQGQAGVAGAYGNDQSKTNHWVYDHFEYIYFPHITP